MLPADHRLTAELHVYVMWRVGSSLTRGAGGMEFGRGLETHTDFISQGGSQLHLPRNTLVPYMAYPITRALSNRKPACAAVSSYSCHAEGHDKKNTLYFAITLNLRPLSVHPSSKDKIPDALRGSLNNNFTQVRAFMNQIVGTHCKYSAVHSGHDKRKLVFAQVQVTCCMVG